MANLKSPQRAIKLVATFSWGVINFTIVPSPVWVNFSKPVDTTPARGQAGMLVNRVIPPLLATEELPDFSGDGRSGNREGGGGRSNCSALTLPLTALIPTSNWGKTVAEHPSFWFYVPYSPQNVISGEFALLDEAGNDVYRLLFTLPKTPGFVGITIPPAEAGLEIDKWYSWIFKIYCDSKPSSSPQFVEGWVQRIELTPAVRSQLDAAKSQDYLVYTSNLIWYDALSHLAELRLNNPSEATLADAWNRLLGAKGVGLEQFSQEPVIGSVILNPLP